MSFETTDTKGQARTKLNILDGRVRAFPSVLEYGAVADARTLVDFATTATSATVTSATASFVAGDVGKAIGIEGAGTSGRPLTATISSVTNSTIAVLSATATATTSGKRGVIGTDNTEPFQDAIDAMTTVGGGTLYVPAGQYLINGDFSDSAGSVAQAAAAQINFPARNLTTQAEYGFVIEGPQRPAPNTNWTLETPPLSQGGAVLISLKSSGTATDSIFGGGYVTGAQWQLSGIRVTLRNLTLRTYNNPATTAINFAQIGQADVEHVLIDHGTILASTVEQTGGGYGLILPGTNNWVECNARDVNVIGYGVGVQWSEHGNIDGVRAWLCKVAFQLTRTHHVSRARNLGSVGCQTVMKWVDAGGVGNHRVKVEDLMIEKTNYGNWKDTATEFDDASNIARGVVFYALVESDIGEVNDMVRSGADGLLLVDMSDVRTALGGNRVVLDFDADDISGSDGDAVASWVNSGTGSAATQPTSGSRPTLQTSEVNTHNAILFDGTDDYIGGTLSLVGGVAVMLITLKWDATAASGVRILGLAAEGGDDHNSATGAAILRNGATSNLGVYRESGYRAVASVSADNWHVLCVKLDGVNSNVSVDGGAFTSVANTGSFASATFRIGADNTSLATSSFFKGLIASVKVYEGAPSPSSLTAEIAALKTKYAIG